MSKLTASIALLALLVFSTPAALAGVCAEDRNLDSCRTNSDPIATCERELQRNSKDNSVRLALCEAHVSNDDLTKALAVVQNGLGSCSGRRCAALRLADSNVRERILRATAKTTPDTDTSARDRAYCTGPIANSRSISACRRLWEANPSASAIAEAFGSKLLKTNQPDEAYKVLSSASNLTAAGRAALASAKAQRTPPPPPTPTPEPESEPVIAEAKPQPRPSGQEQSKKTAPKIAARPEPEPAVVAPAVVAPAVVAKAEPVINTAPEPKPIANTAPMTQTKPVEEPVTVAKVETAIPVAQTLPVISPEPTPQPEMIAAAKKTTIDSAGTRYANAMDSDGRSH